MEATDSNMSMDSRASQDGEQNNDGVLIDQGIEGDRWKSELMDASTGLSMIGKKPDDPFGSLGDRLRDDPSQSLGEAPNDHVSRPTRENLSPLDGVIQSESKDARGSQDREPIADDNHHPLPYIGQRQSTPTRLREGILELGPNSSRCSRPTTPEERSHRE